VFRKGRREGRGTYSFANGAVYEGRFRDDTIDGMGTFNMPNAVFMPAVKESAAPTTSSIPPSLSSSSSSSSSSSVKPNVSSDHGEDDEDGDDAPTQDPLPGDAWMVPINLAQDIGTIHFLAGFDKEGM
jgi:hypothetical protein